MSVSIEGKVNRITFFNPQNNYTVAKILLKNNELITVTGNFYSLSENQFLRLNGEWKNHPKFGEQLIVSSYEIIEPESLEDIEKYLSSGAVKGIGAATAKKIVNKFGLKTIEVLDNNIDELLKIQGLNKSKVEVIKEIWDEQKEIRVTGNFLQNLGFSAAVSGRIYAVLGAESVEIIKHNPYRLSLIIPELQFPALDKIAYNMGFTSESPQRIEAGIIHILTKSANEGNTFIYLKDLVNEAARTLTVLIENLIEAVQNLIIKDKIYSEDLSDNFIPVDFNHPIFNSKIFLSEIYYSEKNIAHKLNKIFETKSSIKIKNIEYEISKFQKENDILFSDKQLFAIKEALIHKIVVITGGPGTGKTTIIKAIINIFDKYNAKIQLAAPTGRAAKRMTESTGCEAKTIHRLLEYKPVDEYFVRDELNPLEADLLILDEASMIDTFLFSKFLTAVEHSTTLVIIGDSDQLPSIGPGSILKDLIDSNVLPTVQLIEIFRQSVNSLITLNAHRINTGQMPILKSEPYEEPDFIFYKISDPEEIVNKIVELCGIIIPENYGTRSLDEIQVLIPMHKGIVGVSNLNLIMQQKLNHEQLPVKIGFKEFRVGDKVMQIKNNYEKDVYNGDLGKIISINKEKDKIFVDYDGKIIKYVNIEIDEIMLAYAITIHKSQGSEYPIIIIPLIEAHYAMLQRNLLYTAITRAKQMVILIGTERAINIAVNRNKVQRRLTDLKDRLIDEFTN